MAFKSSTINAPKTKYNKTFLLLGLLGHAIAWVKELVFKAHAWIYPATGTENRHIFSTGRDSAEKINIETDKWNELTRY